MTIRVLVVDDQALVRDGLRLIIEAQADLHVVEVAADGIEAVASYDRIGPDVVVMDIRMPGMDGIEATRRMVASTRHPGARVLILTTFDLDEHVYAALRAGASGFLLKDTPPSELASAIRVIAAGDALIAPSVTRRLIGAFVEREPRTDGKAVLATLTDRELDVLRLVARGLSNAQIASTLVLGETTIKTHITRILDKLGLQNRVQAAILAHETGLVDPATG